MLFCYFAVASAVSCFKMSTISSLECTRRFAIVFLLLGPTVIEKSVGLGCSHTCGRGGVGNETDGDLLDEVEGETIGEVGGEDAEELLLAKVAKWAALRNLNMSSSVLSSPAQMTRSASGFSLSTLLTMTPLLISTGLTSRFFLPTRISMGNLDTMLFSKWFWHSFAWNALNYIVS